MGKNSTTDWKYVHEERARPKDAVLVWSGGGMFITLFECVVLENS